MPTTMAPTAPPMIMIMPPPEPEAVTSPVHTYEGSSAEYSNEKRVRRGGGAIEKEKKRKGNTTTSRYIASKTWPRHVPLTMVTQSDEPGTQVEVMLTTAGTLGGKMGAVPVVVGSHWPPATVHNVV